MYVELPSSTYINWSSTYVHIIILILLKKKLRRGFSKLLQFLINDIIKLRFGKVILNRNLYLKQNDVFDNVAVWGRLKVHNSGIISPLKGNDPQRNCRCVRTRPIFTIQFGALSQTPVISKQPLPIGTCLFIGTIGDFSCLLD